MGLQTCLNLYMEVSCWMCSISCSFKILWYARIFLLYLFMMLCFYFSYLCLCLNLFGSSQDSIFQECFYPFHKLHNVFTNCDYVGFQIYWRALLGYALLLWRSVLLAMVSGVLSSFIWRLFSNFLLRLSLDKIMSWVSFWSLASSACRIFCSDLSLSHSCTGTSVLVVLSCSSSGIAAL